MFFSIFIFLYFLYLFPSSVVLYYQKFTGNYFPSYDSPYFGDSESWNQTAYNNVSYIWDCSILSMNTEFCDWGGWSTTNTAHLTISSAIYFTYCTPYTNIKVFGGYSVISGKALTKTFSMLPNHTGLMVEYDFLKIDSWDTDEKMLFYVDDVLQVSKAYSNLGLGGTSNFCGAGWNDYYDHIQTSNITHSSNTLNLTWLTTLNQPSNDESYGFKNLKLYLINSCPSTCITCISTGNCDSCPTFSLKLGNICKCMSKFYMNTSPYTRCVECDISCKTCNVNSSSCLSCYDTKDVYNSTSQTCDSPIYMVKTPLEFSGDFNTTALSSWSLSSNSIMSECGPTPLVGGYKNFGYNAYAEKTLTFLMPHFKVSFTMDFFKIDQWNSEKMYVSYDGVVKFTSISFQTQSDFTNVRNLCGGAYNEIFYNIYQASSHVNINLTIKIGTYLLSTSNAAYWGFNNFQLRIHQCHPTCKNCTDGAQNNCIFCYDNATLNSSNYCNCNAGYVMNNYENPCTTYPCSICFVCYSTCLTCNGPNADNCLSCNVGFFLNETNCDACNSTICKTCSGTADNCSSCDTSKYLINLTTSYTCDFSCPYGFYSDNLTNTCKECDSSCATCSNGSSTDCNSCASGYYKSSNGACLQCNSKCQSCIVLATNCISCPPSLGTVLYLNDCISQCPNGYYNRTQDNSCQKCDSSCLQCVNQTVSDCTKCDDGLYVSGIPFGACLTCDFNCKTCNISSTNCTSCTSPAYLNLIDNTCENSCPDGYYKDSTNSTNPICSKCDSSCSKCSGSGSSNCLTCNDGYYISAGLCKLCSGCKTCLNVASNCTSCTTGTFLYGNTCINPCPGSKFGQTSNNTCQACDSNCLTCNDSSYMNCTSCVDGKYLTSENQCAACSSSCNTCKTTDYQCITCKSGSYLMGTNCVSLCLDGFWGDKTDYTCKICDSSCNTCVPPGKSSNCSSCKAETYLLNGKCINCDNNCYTCDILPTSCTSCNGSKYLFNETCSQTCPDKYYPNTLDNTCSPCNSPCLTCYGSLTSNCLSCPTGLIFKNGKCFNCDTSCLTCDGSTSSDCLSCSSSLYLQGTTCVSQCKTSYYPVSNSTKTCEKCSGTCVTCITGDLDGCITCPTGYFFQIVNNTSGRGFCYYQCPSPLMGNPVNWTCVTHCDDGKYLDVTTNQCKSCNNMCLTCFGATLNDCLSCRDDLLKKNTSCVSDCLLGQYIDIITKSCQNCISNCMDCSDSLSCNQCFYNYYLRLSNLQCANQSDEGEYINKTDATIRKCVIGCLDCINNTICIKCNTTFYLNIKKTCTYKSYIQPILTKAPLISNVFYLSFNDTWPNFFNNLTNNRTSYYIQIENVEAITYQVHMSLFPFNTNVWEIVIDYVLNAPDPANITLTLFPIYEDKYNLTTNFLWAEIDYYYTCINNLRFSNADIKNCTALTLITPYLSPIENKPLLLNLSFSGVFEDFFKILINISTIQIDSFNFPYTYYINQTKSNEFLISLQSNDSILGKPKLTVSFTLPGYIFYHPSTRLIKSSVSTNLLDLYILSPSDLDRIYFIDKLSFLNYLFPTLAYLHGFLFYSILSFVGLAACNIIKYMRYIDVSYPPQSLAIFNFELSDFVIISDAFGIDKDFEVPDVFKFYGISRTFLVNSLDKLIKLAVFFLIAVIFKYISLKLPKNHSELINNLVSRFYLSTFLMFLFSFTMDLCFFSTLNIKFPDYSTSYGTFNYFLSIFTLILIIGFHLYLYYFFLKKSSTISPNYTELNKDLMKEKSDLNIFDQNSSNSNSINKKFTWFREESTLPQSPLTQQKDSKSFINIKSQSKQQIVKKATWWKKKTDNEDEGNEISRGKSEKVISLKDSAHKLEEISSNIDNNLENPSNLTLQSPSTQILNVKKEQNLHKDENKNKYRILIKDFQQVSKTQKLYIVFLMMRYMLIPIAIIVFYDISYAGSSFYLSLNMLFLIYILCMQPFSTWVLFIENIIIELCILCSICGSFLIVWDSNKLSFAMDSIMVHGWMIYFGNMILIAFCMMIYIWNIAGYLKRQVKRICLKKNKIAIE